MPDKKRRLEDADDTALASDDGPIFSTVAELVEVLEPSIPEESQSASAKNPYAPGAELLRGTEVRRKSLDPTRYSISFSEGFGCALDCACGVGALAFA